VLAFFLLTVIETDVDCCCVISGKVTNQGHTIYRFAINQASWPSPAYFASQWELLMLSNGPKCFSEAASDANKWAHFILQLQLAMVSNGPTIIPGGSSDTHK
jgi:hypothetical protein